MTKLFSTTALVTLLIMGSVAMAQAQTSTMPSNVPVAVAIPSAPSASAAAPASVSEIDKRLGNQQQQINSGVQDGTINAKQEIKDEKTLGKVKTELSKDEAKNGGTVTKAESRKMNHQLTKNSKRIHRQRVQAQEKVNADTTQGVNGTAPPAAQ